jgi:hypothetical protein
VSGPHPDLRRTRLTIRETRLCAGRVDPACWAATPAGDPFAEAPEHQPGVALLTNALTVAPGVLRFSLSILALVSLTALAEWCAGRPEAEPPELAADLGTLATACAALTEADAEGEHPWRCGGWRGMVIPSPEAVGDGPPKMMAVVGAFAAMAASASGTASYLSERVVRA